VFGLCICILLNLIQSANAAYAKDTHVAAARPSLLSSLKTATASSSRTRDKPVDKWKNYSTASQLGFNDEDTKKTNFEIEQELKGRAAEPGGWETVEAEPGYLYTGEGSGYADEVASGKRKLGEYAVHQEIEDQEGEGFKFEHRGKRPVRDPYEEDWDPKQALSKAKIKVKEERTYEERRSQAPKEEDIGGLDRTAWSGKLELNGDGETKVDKGKEKESGLQYVPGGGWVKLEAEQDHGVHEDTGTLPIREGDEASAPAEQAASAVSREVKASREELEDSKPEIPSVDVASAAPVEAGGLFKKRRPPPGAGRKR
jgi:WW domain-binding protein 4